MQRADNAQAVAVIGAALDLGAGRRGVDMGPSAIRYAGLDARIQAWARRVDWGNVTTAVAEATAVGDERVRFLERDQGHVRADRRPGRASRARAARLPLVLGGDHSVALGTLGGLARPMARAACSGSMRTAT